LSRRNEPLVERLSGRELEVLQVMASGASNQEIAEAMIIAVTTAKKHVSNIIRKLGVNNRTQAVSKGRNLGLCE
jgi:ATP/maltotriose-dependent transcriptional regulator MalT